MDVKPFIYDLVLGTGLFAVIILVILFGADLQKFVYAMF